MMISRSGPVCVLFITILKRRAGWAAFSINLRPLSAAIGASCKGSWSRVERKLHLILVTGVSAAQDQTSCSLALQQRNPSFKLSHLLRWLFLSYDNQKCLKKFHESARNRSIPEPFVLPSMHVFCSYSCAVKREIVLKASTCVFFGYAQSEYRCYDVKSKRLDVSLNVLFNEVTSYFPFLN